MNKRESPVARNFVAPAPQPIPPIQVEVLPPDPYVIDYPLGVKGEVIIQGSYQDRARGFQISTVPLAIGVGVGSLLIAIGLFSVPILSLTALLVLWLGFVATWLLGWVATHLFSPEGSSLVGVLGQFWLLRNEQKERWKYYHDRSNQNR